MTANEMRDETGKLPAFAWPGGYPLFYWDSENSTLCPDCAEASRCDDIPQFKPIGYDVYWEGPPIYCDQCSKPIESAYGDPEEERA